MEVGTSVLLAVVVVNTKCLRAAATGGDSIQQLSGRYVTGGVIVTPSGDGDDDPAIPVTRYMLLQNIRNIHFFDKIVII